MKLFTLGKTPVLHNKPGFYRDSVNEGWFCSEALERHFGNCENCRLVIHRFPGTGRVRVERVSQEEIRVGGKLYELMCRAVNWSAKFPRVVYVSKETA